MVALLGLKQIDGLADERAALFVVDIHCVIFFLTPARDGVRGAPTTYIQSAQG
jgi:hypothetical protein